MPEWVPAYEAYHRSIASGLRDQLLEASAATLDRLLRPCRIEEGKGRSGTKPGTMLRQSIPIRGGSWQESEPGWTEADTVSLCGGRVAGENVWIVDNTDICTTWVEMRGMYGRGQHATVEQLRDIEVAQPFAWPGLDSDNGGEFINRHFLTGAKPSVPSRSFTRAAVRIEAMTTLMWNKRTGRMSGIGSATNDTTIQRSSL